MDPAGHVWEERSPDEIPALRWLECRLCGIRAVWDEGWRLLDRFRPGRTPDECALVRVAEVLEEPRRPLPKDGP